MTNVPTSERERMLSGEVYNSRDPELLALAHRAREQLARLSSIPSTEGAARFAVLRDLFAHVGDGVWIEPPFFCDYGRNISIGAGTFVNVNCVFLDSAEIRIGANVLFGPGVQLLTATHPLRAEERIVPPEQRTPEHAPYRTQARPIVIGDNVWIGAAALVFPGVTIGKGTSIGAGSLVTTDIPANCLALGQPCRVQRRL
jgi:maltose O-acetyltransferase